MKGQKHYTSFQALINFIENEIYDHSLSVQTHMLGDEGMNAGFIMGYVEALRVVLGKAYAIQEGNRKGTKYFQLPAVHPSTKEPH